MDLGVGVLGTGLVGLLVVREVWEVLGAFVLQGFADEAVGEAGGVALAGEYSQESSGAFDRIEAAGGGEAFGDQAAGGGLFLFGVEFVDGVLHGFVRDAASP
jgi:hypothetical protein